MNFDKIKHLIYRYRDVIFYGFFGACSTLLNIAAYYVLAYQFHFGTIISTIFAWVFAVLFAYVVNRLFVFQSQVRDAKGVIREFYMFMGCRLGSELLDIAAMYFFVDCMHYNDMIIKTAANVMVIIVNYIASKFFIFK